MSAFAPDGQPYLVRQDEFAWTKGAVKKEMDIKLPRGVVIRGKVTEQGTGRPLAGASVQYFPMNSPDGILRRLEASVASKDDGSFQIVVPPGKGYLLVFGPTSDYILEEIGGRMLYEGQPGGSATTPTTSSPMRSRPAMPHEITAVLRPGKTVRGRVVGPEGQTVEDAAIITQARTSSRSTSLAGRPVTPDSTPATAASSCTGSTRRNPSRSISSTPTTSGARRSSSPASRPARS